MFNNNFSGTIPSAIGSLSNLQFLCALAPPALGLRA